MLASNERHQHSGPPGVRSDDGLEVGAAGENPPAIPHRQRGQGRRGRISQSARTAEVVDGLPPATSAELVNDVGVEQLCIAGRQGDLKLSGQLAVVAVVGQDVSPDDDRVRPAGAAVHHLVCQPFGGTVQFSRYRHAQITRAVETHQDQAGFAAEPQQSR